MDTIKDFFDEKCKDYDSWYDNEPGKSYFEKEKEILRYNKINGNILEVGVGTGRFAETLSVNYGIDLSFNMLKIAKNREIIVSQAAAERLPFKDNIFSRIYLIVTICFVKNPDDVIRESSRILSKGGELISGIVPRDRG